VINAGNAHSTDDYVLTGTDFDRLRKVVYSQTGIRLGDHKRDLVYNRVARRLRTLRLGSFRAYCDLVENQPGDELEALVNAITTNVTAFFREKHHFEFLRAELLPMLGGPGGRRTLRGWSAGCSSGEEPYSIAVTVAEAGLIRKGWDVRLLATDIDTEILARARSGVYARDKMEGISPELEQRWFQRGTGPNEGMRRVRSELRDRVSFRQLNLMGAWPMKGPFDFIFCRNVAIYFDRETQERLFRRYAELLDPRHGHLFIGHSESLTGLQDVFQSCGNTVYRKR